MPERHQSAVVVGLAASAPQPNASGAIDDAVAFFVPVWPGREHQRHAYRGPRIFTDVGLEGFDVVASANTRGEILDESQHEALQRFIRSGKGYVGAHSAADTEHEWPWCGELVGA